MPIDFNDYLDDVLQYDRQRSCVGGQVSFARVNLLNEDQCAELIDVDIETDLALENRRGFRKWGDLNALIGSDAPQGMWWFDFDSTQYLLVLAGGDLYRCPENGTWALVTTGASPSSTATGYGAQIGDTFWLCDGTGRGKFWTGAELTSGASGTAVTDGAANVSHFVAQRFRLFGLNAATPDEVYASKYLPTDATPFTLSTAILPFRIGEGQGDPVTCLVPWKGMFSLVAVKRSSIWLIDTTTAGATTSSATTTSAFGIQQVGWQGSPAGRTVVRASNDILYLSDDGVRSLARTIDDGEGKVSEPLSQPVDDLIRRINRAAMDTACSTFHAGKYLCAVPIDNAAAPSHILVWNSRNGAWVVWTGIQPLAMVVTQWTGGPKRMMVLDSRGHVLEYRDHVTYPIATDYRDDVTGSDVRPAWYIRTRGLTWGEPVCPKDVDHAEFEFDRSEAIIDIDVRIDNDASGVRLASKVRTGYPGWILAPEGGTSADYPSSTLDCQLGEAKVKRVRKSMTHYPEAREVMFEIREAGELTTAEQDESGVLRMRGVLAGAYVVTKEEQE